MRYPSKRGIAVLIGLIILCTAGADQWPFPSRWIKTSMGCSDRGTLSSAMTFNGDSSPVKPAMPGEVVFFSIPGDTFFETNMGGTVVLEHQNSFRTLYGRLEPDTHIFRKKGVEYEDVLGVSERLLFSVYDMKLRQYVNPARILPPLNDRTPPRIRGVRLISDGRLVPLTSSLNLVEGDYVVLVDCDDPLPARGDRSGSAPYEVVLTLNGVVATTIRFDAVKTEDGRTLLAGEPERAWSDLYEPEGTLKAGTIHLSPGRTVLMLLVADHYGNQSEWVSVINVRP